MEPKTSHLPIAGEVAYHFQLGSILHSDWETVPFYRYTFENLQTGGAFKYRGAMNVLLQLDPARTPVVITHSSGNHGNALALAAKAREQFYSEYHVQICTVIREAHFTQPTPAVETI